MAIESLVVFFPCSDIEKTLNFYTDTVGLKLAQSQGGGKAIILDTGCGFLGFCQYDDGRPIPSGELSPCVSFNCEDEEDVDRQFERLKSAGAEILQPPMRHAQFPVYSCFFRDPDGYKIEFQKILRE